MTHNKACSLIVMFAFATLLHACGDAAGDSPSPAATGHSPSPTQADDPEPQLQSARSDGSVGGDIVALEVWYAELLCACSPLPADLCVSLVWDDDKIACMRDDYNRLASEDPDAADCVRAQLRAGTGCMKSASCSTAREQCDLNAHRATVDQCPPPSEGVATQGQSCFGGD